MKKTCPECGKSNFYITEQMGYCFNCAYKEFYTEYEQVKPSNHIDRYREIYTEIAKYYHSCLSTEHINYLLSRGITYEDIERLQIGYCPPDIHRIYLHPLARECGLVTSKKEPFLSNRIVFPYFFQDKVTDLRGRADTGIRYLSCYGSSVFRGARFAYGYTDEQDHVVITEGEIKAIIGSHSKYVFNGLPGINAKRMITPAKQYTILFDTQKNAKRELQQAIIHLADTLPSVRIATLPLMGYDKMDVDTYMLLGHSIETIIENALDYHEWRSYVCRY